MLPTLFSIGGFELHTFGVMVALGFVAGILWCVYEAGRGGAPRERILDLCFWLIFSGVVGARLLFVAVNAPSYAAYFSDRIQEMGVVCGALRGLVEVFAVWNGGIVWYGGLLTAFAVGARYMRRHQLPVWATADLTAPGVMLGLAVGRLGCLAAGDDYGRVVESAWANLQAGVPAPWWTLTFTDATSLVPDDLLGKPLYPTQVAMSLNALGIFALLVLVRRHQRFHGQTVWTMMLVYAVTRGIIEFYRGDVGRGLVAGGLLSTSQLIGIAVFVVSIAMLFYCRRTQPLAVAPTA